MTAFPTEQRAALTKLRERHPRAQVRITQRRSPVMRVKLRWAGGKDYGVRRVWAEIEPDGRVTYVFPQRRWYRR